MSESEGHPRVRQALAAIAAGGMVVVTDSPDREDEADLIVAADAAGPDELATMIRHGSGIVCVALPAARLRELALPAMVAENTDPNGTAFTVSVDAADAGTGVAAADRARTIAVLADPAARPEELRRPGHVFPLRARPGGVLERPGHTEAALDLARLAGRGPGGVLCELTNDDGTMMRGPEVRAFAAARDLPLVSIEELAGFRAASEPRPRQRGVEQISRARFPTRYGEFAAHVFRSPADGTEHVALVLGSPAGAEPALVRVHSECLTGDALGSLRCDCGDQLELAMETIGAAGSGVVVYLRGHEGRGIGLGQKLAAYALQDEGADTVEANLLLGLPVDSREYGVAAEILTHLGVGRVRLLANNPDKSIGLERRGIEVVDRVPLLTRPRPQNIAYLRAKQERLGHALRVDDSPEPLSLEAVWLADGELCWP